MLLGQISRMDRQPYGRLTRADSGLPLEGNVYLCMQKPFKFNLEFNSTICSTMRDDPDDRVMLHREVSPSNQGAFEGRLA